MLPFDRNVDLDKRFEIYISKSTFLSKLKAHLFHKSYPRFVPGEPRSLEQRSSAGKEFHSRPLVAEYLTDRFSIVLLDVTGLYDDV